MAKIVNKEKNKSNGSKTFRSKSQKVVCHVCKRKVIQQNYKIHLQNKHPNEKGSDISRGGDFVQSKKMVVLPFSILANQKIGVNFMNYFLPIL